MSAILDRGLDQQRLADCAANARAMGEEPYFFLDDDFYVVDARTLKIVRHISCKSCEAIGSELHGFRVHPGQMLLRGMQAKHMGVRG